MFLAFGVVSALFETARSGQGQVVDVSMVEGAAYLMSGIYGMFAAGAWTKERGTNFLDGGAHYYGVYETADGLYVSIGSIEPKFYSQLLERLGLADEELPPQNDRGQWAELRARMAKIFKGRTRDEWSKVMEGAEVCFAPVLGLDEVQAHPHNAARASFIEIDGVVQPAPAPRFSRTVPECTNGAPRDGEHTREALQSWGFHDEEIENLLQAGAIRQN